MNVGEPCKELSISRLTPYRHIAPDGQKLLGVISHAVLRRMSANMIENGCWDVVV